MKIIDNRVEFEDKEETDIFCSFFYKNDYFLRKSYKSLVHYKYYINNILNVGNKLYLDCIYHKRLAKELSETIDNYRRKNKLKKLQQYEKLAT